MEEEKAAVMAAHAASNGTVNATLLTNGTQALHEPTEEEMQHSLLVFYIVM
jgi:hypothetical protein